VIVAQRSAQRPGPPPPVRHLLRTIPPFRVWLPHASRWMVRRQVGSPCITPPWIENTRSGCLFSFLTDRAWMGRRVLCCSCCLPVTAWSPFRRLFLRRVLRWVSKVRTVPSLPLPIDKRAPSSLFVSEFWICSLRELCRTCPFAESEIFPVRSDSALPSPFAFKWNDQVPLLRPGKQMPFLKARPPKKVRPGVT